MPTYRIRHQFRRQHRSVSKSYTKKEWTRFVKPVAESIPFQLVDSSPPTMCEYSYECSWEQIVTLKHELDKAYRRLCNDRTVFILEDHHLTE